MTITEVKDKRDICIVETLAREIWTEHFVPIIGREQVEYMLEKFQSERAISGQIRNEGFRYFLLQEEAKHIAYFAIREDIEDLFLSKLYVRRSHRGSGVGRKILNYIEELARTRSLKTISLTVNKNNSPAIAAYKKMGFENSGEIVKDIGSGFVMDDYLMKKVVQDKRQRPTQ